MKTNLYKIIFITSIFCLLIANKVFSEAAAPELVIKGFIEALQKNDMDYINKYVDINRIKNQRKHKYTINDLKKIFGKVDIKKIKFSSTVYDADDLVVRSYMVSPVNFYFVLQHQNSVNLKNGIQEKGDFFKIINIYP